MYRDFKGSAIGLLLFKYRLDVGDEDVDVVEGVRVSIPGGVFICAACDGNTMLRVCNGRGTVKRIVKGCGR